MAETDAHNKYFPGYDSVKHHEMRTAETCAEYLLPTLKQKAKDKPDLKLLDVGAGSGTITTSLAKYMPHGQAIGVDLSPEVLAQATQHATAIGASNVKFQLASVYSLPFEDGAFDIVHAHQVLLYLDDPIAALRELLRVTRPNGGVAAIRNNDMHTWSWWPRLPALQRCHEVLLATHEAAGGTTFGGIQLISWALRVGVPREKIIASQGTWSYSEKTEKDLWAASFAARARGGPLYKTVVELGISNSEELEGMARAWEQWRAAEDSWFACMHGEILIHK